MLITNTEETSRIGMKKFIGIFDVGLLSCISFFVSYMLINYATADDYGLYVNILSALMLLVGFQNALFCTPMTVLGAKKEVDVQSGFIYDLFIIQLACLLLLASVIAFVIYLIGIKSSLNDKWLMPSLIILFFCWIIREFFRVRGYLYNKGSTVFVGDIIYSLGLFLLIGSSALHYSSLELSETLFYISLSALASIVLYHCTHPMAVDTNKENVSKTFLESWKGGKWSLIGVTATWSQNNSYAYLVSLLISLEATALLAATRLLMMPVNMILTGIYIVLKPKWARIVDTTPLLIRKKSFEVLAGIILFIVIYTLIIAINWTFISEYILGGKFKDGVFVFIMWASVFFLQAIRSRYSNLLQLCEEFKYLAVIGLPVSVVSVLVSMIFVYFFGVVGCLVGSIFAEALLIIFMWRKFSVRFSRNC
jgi:O-antigen/teichoic acid export membrane protein